jgi:superfamily I DNA/RNA helicase/RecB family exonuclease
VTTAPATPRLVLDRSALLPAQPPALDADQQRVVRHRGGPLLVLAGPGTGKTTTLVEAMVARLCGPDALRPDQVLGLTFGRKAAQEWRERVTARLGGGLVPTVTTFHSFAYALVRQAQSPEDFRDPLRLLSGPEQERRLRELLVHSVRDGRLDWPTDLAAALGTRGLAAEVRAVVARARALGLDPDDLARLAASGGPLGPAWRAIGEFLDEYLAVLDLEGVSDYTEVLHRAALIAHDPAQQQRLRAAYPVVLVDELQDTDPAQTRLLRGLVGPRTTFVAAGDPDQSIYAFRGADVGGLLGFPDTFHDGAGAPAPVVVLGTTRRFGPAIGQAAGRVLRGTSLAPLPAEVQRRHRTPSAAPGPEGSVEVVTFDSEAAEAAHIADLLRRAHLEQGVPWHDMAVVVRSGRRSVPPLRRALAAAGVPLEVAADELPLVAEPAVAPLLAALRAAVDPESLDETTTHELLLSPLAGADPTELRRLGRELRQAARAADTQARPEPSDRLLLHAVRALVDDPKGPGPGRRRTAATTAVRRLAAAIRAARDVVSERGTVEETLWAVWSSAAGSRGSGWPQRLERSALTGGDAGRRADADLDAVVALFAAARRDDERYGGRRGLRAFLAELAGQQIPADTLAERGLRGSAVRLLTAHRAKGLEWSLVVVAAVQEDAWPDLRRRGTLLAADRLDPAGLVDPPGPALLLAEERRLFYVACTRARHTLVVTATRSVADDGPQPSRFVTEVAGGEECVTHRAGRPPRPLSVAGLVARLRSTAVDTAANPALRAAATRRLAVLAAAVDSGGRALVPAADPAVWWGLRNLTQAATPVRPDGAPLALSGSQLTALGRCPLQWFLGHEAHGDVARSTALGFGSLVHALADGVARAEVPARLEALQELLAPVWPELGYEAQWQAAAESADAAATLAAFLRWHEGRPERGLVVSEHAFDLELPVGEDRVRLRGSFDRVEVDEAGEVHVVDLKTQKSATPGAELAAHPQLGVYQLAAASGGLDTVPDADRARSGLPPAGTPPRVAGAELVQLRARSGAGEAKVQAQPPVDPDDDWVAARLRAAVGIVRGERFHPVRGGHCRTCSFRSVCPVDDEGGQVIA